MTCLIANINNKCSVQRKSCGGLRWRTLKDPSFFQLPTNYRSHGGIVDCSNSVIELVKRFWPYSIDNLQPERGVVGGVRPVFLTGWEGFQYQNFFTTGNGCALFKCSMIVCWASFTLQSEFCGAWCKAMYPFTIGSDLYLLSLINRYPRQRSNHSGKFEKWDRQHRSGSVRIFDVRFITVSNGRLIYVFRTLYDSKGLEYDDVLGMSRSGCKMSNRLYRSFYMDFLRTHRWTWASGEKLSVGCWTVNSTSPSLLSSEMNFLPSVVRSAYSLHWIITSEG